MNKNKYVKCPLACHRLLDTANRMLVHSIVHGGVLPTASEAMHSADETLAAARFDLSTTLDLAAGLHRTILSRVDSLSQLQPYGLEAIHAAIRGHNVLCVLASLEAVFTCLSAMIYFGKHHQSKTVKKMMISGGGDAYCRAAKEAHDAIKEKACDVFGIRVPDVPIDAAFAAKLNEMPDEVVTEALGADRSEVVARFIQIVSSATAAKRALTAVTERAKRLSQQALADAGETGGGLQRPIHGEPEEAQWFLERTQQVLGVAEVSVSKACTQIAEIVQRHKQTVLARRFGELAEVMETRSTEP